jgi:hypothetical protein
MKIFIPLLFLCSFFFADCSSSRGSAGIEPKKGTIEVPATGEFRMWQHVKHANFTVTITNSSFNQSVELYRVYNNGNEKWVSPSLLANSSIKLVIPSDGHLFIKNFNPNVISITYTMEE